jgi:ABC-2 type transport system permease protein
VPGFILFEGLMVNAIAGWLVFAAVIVLGLLATLPVGVIIGSVVKSPRLIGGLGFLVIGGMAVVSGIFIPIQDLPEWAAWIGQALPTYWVGIGMRFVFLPESAVVLEIGQSWRHLEMFVVLGAWAVISTLIAPIVLRRMARRASGASVEASRLEALQRL